MTQRAGDVPAVPVPDPARAAPREGLRRLVGAARSDPALRRLVAVRLLGHLGDGLVQAALGGLLLFSPEHRTEPAAIAAGFAVLLLPYSMVGPFAAAALDRWDRRWVLVAASALRAVLMVALALTLATGRLGSPEGVGAVLLLALSLAGTSRFAMAGTAAALPHVTPALALVPLNSVLVTLGAVLAGSGALISLGVLALTGTSDTAGALTVALASLTPVLALVLVTRFVPQALGPGPGRGGPGAAQVARDLALGLARGLAAAWQAPRVTAALLGLGAHRAAFGADTLVLVLVLREAAARNGPLGGLTGFGLVVAGVTVGMFLAAVLTPWLLPRLGLRPVVVTALLGLATVQLTLVPTLVPGLLVLAGVLLGLGGQVVKLAGDAAMLLDVPTGLRGQVFACQDMLFNAVFVGALALAAAVVPAHGHAPLLLVGAAGIYLVAALGVVADSRRDRLTPRRR